jgi:DtxR family Mn-dependent transcriptional regulator
MGFGWHEVHDEADAISLALTPRVVERMSELAGHPRRCPHGEPIPSVDGLMPVVHDDALTAIMPPADLALSRVKTADPERLLYLQSLGLTPGQPFRLVNRAPFNGPVRLEIGRQEVVIGIELAGALRVCQPDQFELSYDEVVEPVFPV